MEELRRYPEGGYRRVDLTWSTLIPRMWLMEKLPGRPVTFLHREIMERVSCLGKAATTVDKLSFSEGSVELYRGLPSN